MTAPHGTPDVALKATVACPFCGALSRVNLSRIADRPKCRECARPLLLDRPVHVTDDNFDSVITGTDVPVIVDFYADWCGPCKIMAPLLDDLARVKAGDILVAKLDTDRSPLTSSKYGIRGIPTLVAFSGGKEVGREVGAVPRDRVDALVDRAVQP
jgi:thioredoxin 2